MPIVHIPPEKGSSIVVINISGKFDFSTHKDFRETYIHHTQKGLDFKVDLSETEYMDSSALGMLLMLREYAEENEGKVWIHEPQKDVHKILQIANFDRFFEITQCGSQENE